MSSIKRPTRIRTFGVSADVALKSNFSGGNSSPTRHPSQPSSANAAHSASTSSNAFLDPLFVPRSSYDIVSSAMRTPISRAPPVITNSISNNNVTSTTRSRIDSASSVHNGNHTGTPSGSQSRHLPRTAGSLTPNALLPIVQKPLSTRSSTTSAPSGDYTMHHNIELDQHTPHGQAAMRAVSAKLQPILGSVAPGGSGYIGGGLSSVTSFSSLPPVNMRSSWVGSVNGGASDDKLQSAQRVIRKLYRKNIELASQFTQLKNQLSIVYQSGATVLLTDQHHQLNDIWTQFSQALGLTASGVRTPLSIITNQLHVPTTAPLLPSSTSPNTPPNHPAISSTNSIQTLSLDVAVEPIVPVSTSPRTVRFSLNTTTPLPSVTTVFQSAEEEEEVLAEAAALAEEEHDDNEMLQSSLSAPNQDDTALSESTTKTTISITDNSDNDAAKQKHNQERRHVTFLMEQKERVIVKLQSQLEKYVLRVADLERDARSIPSFLPRASAAALATPSYAMSAKTPKAAFVIPTVHEHADTDLGDNQSADDDLTDTTFYQQFRTLHRKNSRQLIEKLQSLSSLLQPSTQQTTNPVARAARLDRRSDVSGDITSVFADMPKDCVTILAEQQRMLATESTERQMVDITTTIKLFAAEQKSAEWYVERKLLEAEKDELKAQILKRDDLDRHIEARVLTMMDRLKEVENENLTLRFQAQQLKDRSNSAITSNITAGRSCTATGTVTQIGNTSTDTTTVLRSRIETALLPP